MQLTLPEIKTPRGVTSKELLQDSRRGSGRALKFLRAMLAERPDVKKRFSKEQEAEAENQRQRDALQWAQIQSSKVRSASLATNEVKRNTVYTNPFGSGVLPNAPPLRRIVTDNDDNHNQQQQKISSGGRRSVILRGSNTNSTRSTFSLGNEEGNLFGREIKFIVAAEEANVVQQMEEKNAISDQKRDVRLAMKRQQMMKNMKTTELWLNVFFFPFFSIFFVYYCFVKFCNFSLML